LLLTGARIGEVLLIKQRHISTDGLIYIPALKGSNPRVLSSPSLQMFFLEHSGNNEAFVFPYNYKNCYTLLHRYLTGVVKIELNKSQSVTHWFRYSYIASLLLIASKPGEFDKTLIGHKSVKSTLHYLRRLHHG